MKNVDSLLKAELEKLGVPVERLKYGGTMKRARRNSRIKYTSIQKRITSTFFNA